MTIWQGRERVQMEKVYQFRDAVHVVVPVDQHGVPSPNALTYFTLATPDTVASSVN